MPIGVSAYNVTSLGPTERKAEVSVNGKGLQCSVARRSFLARLGIGTTVLGATINPPAAAQAGADVPWRPARHAEDDWLDQIPGEHRIAFDTTTADGMALALRFASNYFAASQRAYGLKEYNLAVVIIVRHKSTSFGYNDATWMKYGKYFSEQADFTDPKTKEPPKLNAYTATQGDLIQKGVHFAVCQVSTEAIARAIAAGTGAEAGNIVKELSANLVGNGQLVPAGIVAVNRAQERGYSLAYAI
jgi:hypothetical protein